MRGGIGGAGVGSEKSHLEPCRYWQRGDASFSAAANFGEGLKPHSKGKFVA